MLMHYKNLIVVGLVSMRTGTLIVFIGCLFVALACIVMCVSLWNTQHQHTL